MQFIINYPFLDKFELNSDSDYYSSLCSVMRAVSRSNNKVYIIVDDCDIFATDLLFKIDTLTPRSWHR